MTITDRMTVKMNTSPLTIEQLSSDVSLETAFAQLCEQWRNKGDNHLCWHLRFHWAERKPAIQKALRTGQYRFAPCRSVKINDHSIGIWDAEDALVIKALTNLLGGVILPQLSSHCKHIKGNGGLKQAVMQARRHTTQYVYVLKSDVKRYYASMKHALIMKQFRRFVQDAVILDLLWQFLTHLDDVNGELFPCMQGIGKGSSLSPLIAALYLDELDRSLTALAEKVGGVYLRYMDDWLFLCRTRWHLRKAVKQMNRILVELKVTKAENKTFIGRTVKGFDWLGYRIEPADPMPVRTSAPENRALAEH